MIIDSHNEVSEIFVHVELLDHGVHVADITEIFHAGVAIYRTIVHLV
jgi:hypothetical protein